MKIHPQNNINPQFKAHKIAQIRASINKNQFSDIDIYSIHKNDFPCLKKLENSIDFKTLFPSLTKNLQERWKRVLSYCIDCAEDIENRTFLAVKENKPCGILTFTEGRSFHLDGLCSIPQETDKKVPFVGLSLMYQLFKNAQAYKCSEIKLEAVTDGPFDVVQKYEKLGFKKDITTYPYTEMRCNKYQIKEQLKNFQEKLEYIPQEAERVSLTNIIN